MDYKSEAVQHAYQEWQQAINIFNNVTEKEDVSFAIFNLETKRKKYLMALTASAKSELDDSLDFT